MTDVEPAQPLLPQFAETTIILSHMLIKRLGMLWIVLLLSIGGTLGAEAASVPIRDGSMDAAPQSTFASGDDENGNGDFVGGDLSPEKRLAILEDGLRWHQRGEYESAGKIYSRLLEVEPNDPDGLHLLGLARHSQGNLLRDAADRRDESKVLFDTAARLVRSAMLSATSNASVLSMKRNLGEILRCKGDLEEAEMTLREVIWEQEEAGVDDQQASYNLAVTLVEIIRRGGPVRCDPPNDETRSDIHSEREPDGTAFTCNEDLEGERGTGTIWEKRLEAENLLRKDLLHRPNSNSSMLELAALFNSNWELERGSGTSGFNTPDRGTGPSLGDGNGNRGTAAQGHASGDDWPGGWGEQALFWLERAASLDPSNAAVALECAVALHRLGRIEVARQRYSQILDMQGAGNRASRNLAKSNLALIQHESGDVAGAVDRYRELLAENPENPVVLNNLGTALQGLEKYEEGAAMLEKSLGLDPLNPDVMENLGMYWQNAGDLERARSLYSRAERIRRNDGLPIRRALMLSPIMTDEQDMIREKDELSRALDGLIERNPPLIIPDAARAVGRVHFYLVYRGGNDRVIQEKIARMYTLASPGLLHVTPNLQDDGPTGFYNSSPTEVTLMPRKNIGSESMGGPTSSEGAAGVSTEAPSVTLPPLRVGFVSMFFGEQEPHGMLLDGVVRHLPRKHFYAIVCPVQTPGRWLSPKLAEAADEVVQLPMKLDVARTILGSLNLDILVYADMNSEPITHFLGYSRLAKVQAAFWGNPVTTGNPAIDYFVSADIMEPQNRTVLSEADEAYSEQVVLLGGQGIWYDRMQLPLGLGDPATREATKATLRGEMKSRLGVDEDSVIFMCPQSLFKLKPDFDLVLKDILLAFNNNQDSTGRPQQQAYLVVTEGRRKPWTETFWQRLSSSVPEIVPQVKMLPRTSAGAEFHQLLASADVILHPFPFGGSKTSADGLALGVPVVAMEGSALPGRMALSLYTTMGLGGSMNRGCCVARDRDSYVQLAIRLGRNANFREWASDLISRRSPALWERRDVVWEWSRFLSRAAGRLPSPEAREVGLTQGADRPLLPPEPFQDRTLPTEQQDGRDLLQPPAEPFQDRTLPTQPLKGEHVFEEGVVSTRPPTAVAIGTLEADQSRALSTESNTVGEGGTAIDSLGVEGSLPAADTIRDKSDSDHDGKDKADFNVSMPGLLRRFSILYRDGRLEEAAVTLYEALGIIESRRGRPNDDGTNALEGGVLESTAVSEEACNVNDRLSAIYGGLPESRDEHRVERDNDKRIGPRHEDDRGLRRGDGYRELTFESAGASTIAGVMNDLGCTLQQLWRLDEAEAMLRGAIKNRPGYFSAMTALGVTLQAKNELDEAEYWYRHALDISPPEWKDAALVNLVLLMRAEGGRLQEAIDLIIRETSAPPLRHGGAIIATLSLLQPRPTHEQEFRRLENRDGWPKWPGHPRGLWEETTRLREMYPLSINSLVVFLSILDGLGGVFEVLRGVAGIEPLFFPDDEADLLPQELHAPPWQRRSRPTSQPADPQQNSVPDVSEKGKFVSDRTRGSRDGGGGGERVKQSHHLQRSFDHHSLHLVTQYYVPKDPHRAREIDACLMRNVQNRFIGTVHILTDHPDAVSARDGLGSGPSLNETALPDATPHMDHDDDADWVGSHWRPPVMRVFESELAEKVKVMSLAPGRRLTFQDAIRYSNHVLSDQVVLLSNSDIAFDESLVRLGDPSTLNMVKRVFALNAWQSKIVSVHDHDDTDAHDSSKIFEDPDMIYGAAIDNPEFAPRIDSQDVWIFRSPLPSRVVDASDFEMGRPRCDGRLAQVLLDAGYSVTNPSLSLIARHVHEFSRHRELAANHGASTSKNKSLPSSHTYRGDTQVTGNTASVLISDQWLF